MTQIEKVTRDGDKQYFEKYSRKELAGIIRDIYDNLAGCKDDYRGEAKALKITLEDFSVYWTLKDGITGGINAFDGIGKKPAASRIENLYIDDGSSVGFFGNYEIVQDEKYGDWMAEEI